MYNKELTSQFLEKYKEFENIREHDFKRFTYYQKRDPDKFELFRNIRNNLAHNTIDEEYPFVVSDNTLKEISDLVTVMQERLIERSIHFKNLFYATMDSNVKDIIKVMVKSNFEYIPIIEDGYIKKVFSPRVLLHYINDHKVIEDDLKMKDLESYLDIEIFRFYDLKTYTYEVIDLFHRYYDGKRIGCIFITANGSNNERILGMVTSYEV